MKKKLITVLLFLGCVIAGSVGLTACDKRHSHIWSQGWESNDNYHWHNCTQSGCPVTDISEKDGYAIHDFTNGDCLCGQPAPHSHVWSQGWENDDTYHWHNCTASGCTVTDISEKDGYALHDFTNGDCLCGQPAPHSHVWSQGWENDDTYHWHNCTQSGCPVTDISEKNGYAIHDFTNGDCLCGKKKFTEGLKYTVNSDGESYSVTGIGTATETDIFIASEFNGKPVTSIGKMAFNGCTGLTSITIPDSVTSIGKYAFNGCTGLTSVTIPDSVTGIGDSAFEDCTGLTSITIPESVTEIGGNVVLRCISLTSITVKNGNTKYHSVENCLIETATKTLIAGCKNSDIPTDGSVTSIGKYAFNGCTGLTSITIPDSVTSIGKYAFNGCTGLTSVTIPDSVTGIGDSAFEDCTGLTSITIPESVTEIGGNVVLRCISLTSITVKNGNTKYHSVENCLIETATKTLIAGCKNSDIPTDGNVTSIGISAFNGCTGLTSITIPDSVTFIDNYAFNDCSGLTSITIPDSVTGIGDSAFEDCTGLTSITIGNSVIRIGQLAFKGCTRLTSITIPDSVTIIGFGVFINCRSLESITIPFTGLINLGTTNMHFGYLFNYVYPSSTKLPASLKTVVITGDKSINNVAFKGCTGLTNITIHDGVTKIGNGAFEGCTGLTSITIGNSVTSIGGYAFEDCTGLTSITFKGTKAQWNAISKDPDWDYKTGNYTVCCTDGYITKS